MPALFEPLPVLLDAEAAVGEAVRVPPPERPLLHEDPVRDDEADGNTEARKSCPRRGLASTDCEDKPGAAEEGDQADCDGQPRRHRIGPRQREARERPDEERDKKRRDDSPPVHVWRVAISDEGALRRGERQKLEA